MHSLPQSGTHSIRTNPCAARLILLASLLAVAPSAPAQGCAQCRDNAAATPPATQAAYRHAILLLVAAAGTIFTSTLILLKRSR